METFRFRALHLPKFAAGMAKLQAIATKLEVAPMTFTVTSRETVTETETVYNDYGVPMGSYEYEVEYVTVDVDGTSPKLPQGFTYVGALEHTDAGNIVHGDDEALADYRTASADCEHCGFKRNRKKTVVLRSEEGTLTQVGSACLKDFLGYHGDANRLVAMLESVSELANDSEESFGIYSHEHGTPTVLFLAVVSACVRACGWTAKSAYRGTPTADMAKYVLGIWRPSRDDKELLADLARIEVTEADEEEARKVREWALAIPADTRDNYLGNVRIALSNERVAPKHFGIAASAVSARRKAEEKETAREVAEGKRKASQHVGSVGARETFTVSVLFVRAFDNDYGTSYLVEMEDANGNIVKTFNSGKFGYAAKRGDSYVIKGTVKSHETFRTQAGTDVLSTMLARVAIVETLTEGPETD